MKKFLLYMLLVFSLCTGPAGVAEESKPYLAVFASPGFMMPWIAIKPDLYIESENWNDLTDFLDLVEVSAGDRDVIIDLDSHGDPTLEMLALDGDNSFSECSFGFVINRLNKYYKSHKNLVVISEACFAGNVYAHSLNGYKKEHHSRYLQIENAKRPDFPIYGAWNLYGWGNLAYLQYKFGQYVELYDVRNLKWKTPDTDKDSLANQVIRNCFIELYKRFKIPSIL